jgi:hypothetical protein
MPGCCAGNCVLDRRYVSIKCIILWHGRAHAGGRQFAAKRTPGRGASQLTATTQSNCVQTADCQAKNNPQSVSQRHAARLFCSISRRASTARGLLSMRSTATACGAEERTPPQRWCRRGGRVL